MRSHHITAALVGAFATVSALDVASAVDAQTAAVVLAGAPPTDAPPTVRHLISQWNAENSVCVGPTSLDLSPADEARVQALCDHRDQAQTKLQALGWCHEGTDRAEAAWLPCEQETWGPPAQPIPEVGPRNYRLTPDLWQPPAAAPTAAKYLIQEWLLENEDCRGGDMNTVHAQAACWLRDRTEGRIAKLGWCWGEGPIPSEADARWLPCKRSAQP